MAAADRFTVPAMRRLDPLLICNATDAYVAEEPASLDRTTPVFLKPVCSLVLTFGSQPLHQLAMKMDADMFQ